MLSLEELSTLIDGIAVPDLPTETLAFEQAAGRMLAEDIRVPFDQPREALSAMDGYAIRLADFLDADGQLAPGYRADAASTPATASSSPDRANAGASTHALKGIPVSQRVPAGSIPSALMAGTAARIFTGAMVPEGADTVVMQENTVEAGDGRILLSASPRAGQNVRKPGDELRAGDIALPKGSVITPGAFGLLAAMGLVQVPVVRRIRVGLLFTGDELRQPGETLARGQIYNSNRWMWRALLDRPYIELEDIGQVPDRLDATRDALRQLAHCDLILSSGGVSVGEEDHVRDALALEGSLQAWKVAMKPGKPIAIGQVRRLDGSHALFAGLPGNPVSSFAGFLLLLRPLIARLAGCAGQAAGQTWASLPQARVAAFEWAKPDQRRTEFLRARLGQDGHVQLHPNQQSAALAAVAWADGFVRIAPGLVVKPGDPVPYLPFSALSLP